MQGIRLNRGKRIIFFIIIPLVLLTLFILIDQATKYYFSIYRSVDGIKGIFGFKYTQNTGSAFSFLGDKSWGQLFFKIITPIALVLFVVLYIFAFKKSQFIYAFSLIMMISGTIGNYIDRIRFSYVRDFVNLEFINFAIFNVADILLTVGVTLLIIHFMFLDDNAVFKKNDKKNSSK